MYYYKIDTFSVDIEDFIYLWGQLIVGDLENGGQAADEHVGRLFQVRLKIGC